MKILPKLRTAGAVLTAEVALSATMPIRGPESVERDLRILLKELDPEPTLRVERTEATAPANRRSES